MVGIYGNRVAGYLGGIGNPTDGKQLGNPCRSVGGYGVFLFSFLATIHERRWQWPNEPKLSHGGGWRGLCRWAERRRRSAAQAVTAGAVGCSAWLGVAVIGS